MDYKFDLLLNEAGRGMIYRREKLRDLSSMVVWYSRQGDVAEAVAAMSFGGRSGCYCADMIIDFIRIVASEGAKNAIHDGWRILGATTLAQPSDRP
jgi:hypothetical protein